MNAKEKSSYAQEMKAKLFDIEAGKLIAVLNERDAKELGIMPNDRIEIFNPKSRKRTDTVVDTTRGMVKENELGMFSDVSRILFAKKGQKLEVRAAPRPESVEFIKKKLRGIKLNESEIKAIVKDLGTNKLSDIEGAAFVAAVYTHGYDLGETVAMTKALTEDGLQMKISKKPVVDKHCIGGINGRTTLILVPILASAGLFVPKTSSRSITSAAGTADSMEVLANVCLSMDRIKKITEKVGGVICWGGAIDLAPVDDKIIKLEHPLSLDPPGQVIASVMAKKASVGAKYVVIDLPVGPDVKISSNETAKEMASQFIEVGKKLGMKVEVAITDGTKPCGKAFGPALEAKYAMEILEGNRFDNLAEKACELAGVLFEMVGKCRKGKGAEHAKEILGSGKALAKMREIIKAQGARVSSSAEITPAKYSAKVIAKENGKINKINVRRCIEISKLAGCAADKKAGLMLHVEENQKVRKGQVLFEIFAENQRKLRLAKGYARKKRVIELEQAILERLV